MKIRVPLAPNRRAQQCLSTTEKFVLPEIDDERVLHLDLPTTVTANHLRRARKV
jgi:hypothetical protein